MIPWNWGDKRVLDIGSGTGFCIQQWKSAGVGQLVGSDFATHAVRRLQRTWPDVPVMRIDITEADLLVDGPFDAISAFDVLFHITDDEAYRRAFKNIGALLRPGGYLLCTENFLHGWEERSGHLTSRDVRQIEATIAEAGLAAVRRLPVFVLMNRPIDSPSRLRQWCWRQVERLAIHEVRGWLAGAALYPIEAALTRVKDEGPSTELMLCRRNPSLR
jgi:SAM-dependent methyltransferase